MKGQGSLDLSVLSQFRAADLLAVEPAHPALGEPKAVALHRIELDPSQPRRCLRDDSLEELAESIRLYGVLEPVSLRRHPRHEDRYIVNRGERRVRAARRAGLAAIPAFMDERCDPFAQAAENLHREDMSPFDLAAFIAERESAGYSRAEIARRLGKPRSFITEAARLNDAPEALRQAAEQGRVGADVRALYQLVTVARERPEEFQALLARGGPIGRARVDEMAGRSASSGPKIPPAPAVNSTGGRVSGGRTVLIVEHGGRRGSLRIKACDGNVGEVRFGDGTQSLLPLSQLQPVCWATEE